MSISTDIIRETAFATLDRETAESFIARAINAQQAALTQAKKDFIMPYGKHKGKPLSECPRQYLLWLSKQLAGSLAKEADANTQELYDSVAFHLLI